MPTRLNDPRFLRLNNSTRAILFQLDLLKNKNDLVSVISTEVLCNEFYPFSPYPAALYIDFKKELKILVQREFIQILKRGKKFFVRVIPRYGKTKRLMKGYTIVLSSELLSTSFLERSRTAATDHFVHSTFESAPTKRVTKDQIQMVFDTWRQATGQTRMQFTTRRQTAIKASLREYPIEDILMAVKGIAYSNWHNGDNEQGIKYLKLKNVFDSVEKFRDLAEEHGEEPYA